MGAWVYIPLQVGKENFFWAYIVLSRQGVLPNIFLKKGKKKLRNQENERP
jgi:hypothetical protein